MSNPEEYEKIDSSASLIAKEMFGIRRQVNKHFNLYREEVYMVAFGYGAKTELNPKGFYCYWTWFKNEQPYGGLMNCELKTKYDGIDYYQTAVQNAVETIDEVLRNEGSDGKQESL